jgi:hypothetical protein
VELPDRVLDLPVGTADAVHRVLDGEPVTVADLPGLDAADAAVVVARLLTEGAVVPR